MARARGDVRAAPPARRRGSRRHHHDRPQLVAPVPRPRPTHGDRCIVRAAAGPGTPGRVIEEGETMTTPVSAPVVDADGHVLEPADTWLKYLDPAYRDRAIRIARDERDYEVL